MINTTPIYESNSFCMFPKEFFTEYKTLSTDAKVLYTFMLDRHQLSIQNNWKDKDGNTYIIFTINSIKEIMGCGKTKAIQLLNQLRDPAIGLIKTVRRGLNKPNLIYVKNIIPTKNIISSNEIKEDKTNEIKEKIKFDEFGQAHQDIINDILKALKSKKVKISKNFVKSKQIIDGLTQEVLTAAFSQMANANSDIRNVTSYLLTVIYNIITGTKTSHTTTLVTPVSAPVKVPTASKPKQNRFCNYEQRDWDFSKIRELERLHIKEQLKR